MAGAIFVAMLELTLVPEGWPLRRFNRFAGGIAALAVAWGIAIVLYETLVAGDGPVPPGEFGAVLVCMGVLQVAFYAVLRGWPFCALGSRARRVVYLALARVADLQPATMSAVAGSAVAAGLVVGMLFEGWLEWFLPSARARLAKATGVAIITALLYVGLRAYAQAVGWTHAEPEEWIAYAGLNAIGVGVLLHVAIGHRWPFASPEECAAVTRMPIRA